MSANPLKTSTGETATKCLINIDAAAMEARYRNKAGDRCAGAPWRIFTRRMCAREHKVAPTAQTQIPVKACRCRKGQWFSKWLAGAQAMSVVPPEQPQAGGPRWPWCAHKAANRTGDQLIGTFVEPNKTNPLALVLHRK